jgi:flagellar motility protein MotE (MotC chaperone)
LSPGRVALPVQAEEPVAHAALGGPSWDFINPELDRLLSELKHEKEALAKREQQLNELALRLQAERAEINQITQTVSRLQQEFDRNYVRVRDEEAANLKKLAKLYTSMSAEGAMAMLRLLSDEDVVKMMVFMKDSDSATLLDGLAKGSEADAKRAVALADKLRSAVFRNPTPKP